MSYWPLLGIAIVVVGFALRFNPLMVVVGAALATGVLAGLDIVAVIEALGKAFNDNRYITVTWIILPVIGLLERYGLQQRARAVIEAMRGATMGRLLVAYLAFRQLTSALGMKDIGGHPQAVRPLVAPMAEAAAIKIHGDLSEGDRDKIKAMAAATDNVGLFFGEDIFFAIASILLIQGVFESAGYPMTPLQLSVWAIPTAICAFLIHGGRILAFDRRLGRARQ
ncbi:MULTISPECIES: DUF969 domain-containing protein [unclassified Sphingobium]|jgi:uncharacterized membrane protein|uniref:DUF969 domain-containing protein n=1 Tax=unclassified Sphingobium TaxID=2611147 RepID=UPI000452AAFC|nr:MULTISPECIES: DUF969 domain-containing protein [unclassified Sphingobium]EXS68594.1 membrane protein [Sphingobium sp. Ant17]KFL48941.1 hypothetical protein IL54_4158 [Sphingobium sp. ba1]MDT7531932.1 DUF969 domain-containing protein [Sphingobium sp. SA2]